jgi:hypothetical protein
VKATIADDTQILEIGVPLVYGSKDLFEIRLFPKVVKRMGAPQELQVPGSLSDEKFNDSAVVFDLSLKVVYHSLVGESGVLYVDDPAHQKEGKSGTDEGEKHESTVESSIGFPGDLIGKWL